MPTFEVISWIASLSAGGAAGLLLWRIVSAVPPEHNRRPDRWQYDQQRLAALREGDLLCRLFPAVIQGFAQLNRSVWAGPLPRIRRELQTAGLPTYWRPEEYLARVELASLLMLPVYLYLGVTLLDANGVVAGLLSSGLTGWLLRHQLTRSARQRVLAIKRRLPFFLDLLTLLMEAGASFLQALKQALVEFQGHPLATEFERVLTDIHMGKSRSEALTNLRKRLNDDELNGIVAAILQAEQLGTPLSQVLRNHADLLRVKRSQRAETIAAEAAVNMLLPATLVMLATVLIILGPFLLNYLYSGLL